MLIQSSLPSSVQTAPSCVSDCRDQEKSDLCHQLHFVEASQKPPDNESCSLNSFDIIRTVDGEETKVSEVFSNSDMSVEDSMCTNFSSKGIGYVYKRRKLLRSAVALLSEESASETSKESACTRSCFGCEEHSLKLQKDNSEFTGFRSMEENIIMGSHHLQDQTILPNSDVDIPMKLVPDPNSKAAERCVREEKNLVTYSRRPAGQRNCIINGRCSPSKSNKLYSLDYQKGELEDAGECSSSDGAIADLLPEFASAKDLCTFVLKSNGLLGGVCQNNACASIEVLGDNKSSLLCKKCCRSGKALQMLICDLCEEAFHISCIGPKIRKLPFDEWYCEPCSEKIPRPVLDEKSSEPIDEKSNARAHKASDRISFMLKDRQPYTTQVRIGKDFQAEVPDWSITINDEPASLEEPSKIDPADYACPITCDKASKSTSIGNWVQCREIIYNNDDEGRICGKWRRAPLFVVQSEDWDCSCALPWDPIHADCAVPQEMETDVVLQHLKYIEMLRPRLANLKPKPA